MSLSIFQGLPITGFGFKQTGVWGSSSEFALALFATGGNFHVLNICTMFGTKPLDRFMAGYGFGAIAYYVNIFSLSAITAIADYLKLSARSQILMDRTISWILTATLCSLFVGGKIAFIGLLPVITIAALTSIYDYLTFDPSQNDFRSLKTLLDIT